MVEQITSTNIKKYIGYLASPKIPEDMQYLGMEYGGEAVGSCSLRINGFTLSVDELHMDMLYKAQIVKDLLDYLCFYAWNNGLQIIEIYTADSDEIEVFQEYGIRFDTASVSYQCSMDELQNKPKIKDILAFDNAHLDKNTLYDFEHPYAKTIPKHLQWLRSDPAVLKKDSFFVWNHNEISSMCVVAKDQIDGKTYYRLAYLYAENPMKMVAVLNASLKSVLCALKCTQKDDAKSAETTKEATKGATAEDLTDIQFTFAAVNPKSIALAQGLGFEESEIRSRCERGRVLLYELIDEIYWKEATL